MRRKTVLIGGLILTLLYSLMLLASIFLLVMALLYTFTSNSVQIIEDIFTPVLSPFLEFGEDMLLIAVSVLIAMVIFSLICSSRFIKYSDFDQEKFVSKKGLYIFYLVWFILTCGLYLYFLIQNISQGGFRASLLENVLLCIILGLQVISIVILIFGIAGQHSLKQVPEKPQPIVENNTNNTSDNTGSKSNNKDEEEIQIEQSQAEDINWDDYISHDKYAQNEPTIPVQKRPPIYTAGLDGESEEKVEVEKMEQKQEKNVKPLPESKTTKQVISGITKLDAMRKSGKITQTQYTKLRNKLIRKLTKDA